MIVLHGTISFDPAQEEVFLAAVADLEAVTNTERGCAAYVFTKDLKAPGTVHVFEEWADEESLAAHMAADHFRAFGRIARGMITGRSIDRYEASGKSQLG